jgi:hypothetical protein
VNIKKELIFLAGDLHGTPRFPWFAFGERERLVSVEEALEAVSIAEPGDIWLHRNRGDFSNLGIPGCMKHAWISVDSSPVPKIVEAVSEGIRHRHPLYPLMTDYAVLLTPNVSWEARTTACGRAAYLVGQPYDWRFRFDLENEEQIFTDKTLALENMRSGHFGFSCSETVALCYVGCRRQLGLYRVRSMGRQVILPDNFLTTHFTVKWVSSSLSGDVAADMGLHEEGCDMLRTTA